MVITNLFEIAARQFLRNRGRISLIGAAPEMDGAKAGHQFSFLIY
jgi:hypothetical protein